ncbi:MAG: Transcription-repair-coupling factor [Pseudomonadota bacterium]|jgi:transcription-repair coupling factor (superfamily II helicase)
MNSAFKAYNIGNYLYMQYMSIEANNQNKESISIVNIDGSDSYSLARYIQDEVIKNKKYLAIFTETAFEARRLMEEILWFNQNLKINLLPDWETLPYDHFSPHPDLISERLLTLYQVTQKSFDVVIIPVTTALHLLPPKSYIQQFSFHFAKGQKVDIEAFKNQLTLNGYMNVVRVMAPGEFSVRGSLIDLFPMGSIVPYRLDFFDDEIDSIRTFDVDSQRTLYPVNEIKLLPARECPLDEKSISTFRQNYRERFEGDPSRSSIYKDISKGIPIGGIEWYMPLFFDEMSDIFSYFSDNTIIYKHGNLDHACNHFWQETEKRFRLFAYDAERPILEPKDLLLKSDQFFKSINAYKKFELKRPEIFERIPDVSIDRKNIQPLAKLNQFISENSKRIFILADSLGRRETVSELLKVGGIKFKSADDWSESLNMNDQVVLTVSPVHQGYISSEHIVITESELYVNTVRQSKKHQRDKNFSSDAMVRDLSELKDGDPIVHEQYGVGRFRGLFNLDFGEGESEFLLLEYFGDDKLYIPVSNLDLISRYSGGPAETAPLHKLGSDQWDKAKKKALKQIHDTAADLLNIYSQRSIKKGYAFKINLQDYERFTDGFPFEETEDQLTAINAVMHDMESQKPMDRLICGDVGFGKTEVALRAAFIAANDGKQVAILVPTTLLAEQHYNNFMDRFSGSPIKIAEISRFKSKKEQAESLIKLANGEIDIIIGTHRLIQNDIKFKNLGLIIIDEEHRFGVRQKELLKAMRAEVDVLTLTATPIPRTLSMAMEGLREFSIISTPPQKRLSIKTFVNNYSEGIIREAVLREFNRGGQVYFLHNDVETILSMKEKLEKLIPEARIEIAHGQMRERELERVMHDFYQQKANILLCTTIIETGIDIPSANTIIMNRADMFGLAQLHQLRGRVGRSHHQAYAYLLIDPDRKISSHAQKRLEAIQLLEDLGAGYYLAIHDLEIRGAGELLGDNQSGQMHEIGFNLYIDMLNYAVKQLKLGKKLSLDNPLQKNTEINLHTPAIITNSYCGDINERLVLYKRLSGLNDYEALMEMKEELIDRFGVMPEQTQSLISFHDLRIFIQHLDIKKIDASDTSIQISFASDSKMDPLKLIKLLGEDKRCRMNGPDKIKIGVTIIDILERVKFIKDFLKKISI